MRVKIFPLPIHVSAHHGESKLHDEQHEGHKVYTSSGQRVGVARWDGAGEPPAARTSLGSARRSVRARRASDMSVMVGRERSGEKQGGGRRIPVHPYLARQMPDFGFRQTL